MAYNFWVYRHASDRDIDFDMEPLPQRTHGIPSLCVRGGSYNKPSVFRAGTDITVLPGHHLLDGHHSYSREIFLGAHWNMADPVVAMRRLKISERMSKFNKENGYGIQDWNVRKEDLEEECRRHLNDPELPIMARI
jgi:hypothetical protein